jgi:glycosyltransferase involved in cell wall biosynthesis
MRIAFLDLTKIEYRIESVYEIPLGGSQSALCYLAEELSRLGHEIFLFKKTPGFALSLGVHCLNLENVTDELLSTLDVVIVVNTTYLATALRSILPSHTVLILWTGHAPDQAAIEELRDPEIAAAYDAIVFVSNWQRELFCQTFGLKHDRTFIIGNAIAPSFYNLFAQDESISACKFASPTLVYTSTPFRGLDLLLLMFPKIRSVVPEVKLQVFSSMQVYQRQSDADQARYGHLYHQCRSMEGVEYFGSLPQPQLAQWLKPATVLAYPNTFAETSCIAVMEAMASGCHVITSHLGALPETTAGFAQLIPVQEDWSLYQHQFIEATIATLQQHIHHPKQAENHLRQQVDFVHDHYGWPKRAEEWIILLTGLQAYREFTQRNYKAAINLYTATLEAAPEITRNYGYLGLALLFAQEEEQAYLTWTTALLNGDSHAIDRREQELLQILHQGLDHCQESGNTHSYALLQEAIQNLSQEAWTE